MNIAAQSPVFVPQFDPQKMNGKLTYKIIIKEDYIRTDGTCALYVQLYLNGRKRLPLDIAVPPNYFDKKKQRIIKKYPHSDDYNLLIEKVLSDINTIEVNYRLSNQKITLEKVICELQQPSLRIDYNAFAKHYLKTQKDLIKDSTYRQQVGALQKIERFKSPIYFYEINEKLVNDLRAWMLKDLKNKKATVESTIKTFKKYLHQANNQGINTELSYNEISVGKMTGQRTFLLPEEVKLMMDYNNSIFIKETHKNILTRYLFSCFTGIRISDIEQLKEDNFIGNHIAFTMKKTEKFIRIKLNKHAKSLVELPQVFNGSYARETMNEELKVIAKILNIKKNIYFHSSRHTFATNFLMCGGRIEHLQKMLGHESIKTTMIYSHIVQSVTDDQIDLMDNIFNN
ncbi:tyrosine-type recombinase/integrase [Aquimarina sp. W85]|uniref:site-specific integrase n=1 Tax=Aquimarina rhodophyticola TaxID=3342246 RepID=UPI00366CAF02